MPFRLKVPPLLLILALSLYPRAEAQVRDDVADSGDIADSTVVPPIGGIGSLAHSALPVAGIPDTALGLIPFRSTGDLLRNFTGVFVSETGLGGFRRKFSVNGLSDGAVSFLADGLLLNDPSTGLYMADIYPADFAESIEFAPSPGGFSHAPGGAGGVLNFVSRSTRAPRPFSRIRYSQSAYGYSVLDGSLRQDVARGVNVALGVQHPVSDGRYANSAFDAWNARVKLRYDLDGAAVYVSDIFTRWERGLNDGVSLSTPESLRFEPIRALVVNPSATEKLVRHDVVAGGAIGREDGDLTTFDMQFGSVFREYRDEAGGSGSTGTPFRDTREEQSYGFRIAHSRGIAGSRLAVALEMRNRRLLQDPNIGTHGSTQAGISGSLALKIGPSTISPAARFDRYLDLGRLSVGADVRLRIAGILTVTGGFSRSHRFPSFAEAFGVRSLALPLSTPDPERHDVIAGGLFAGDSGGTYASVSVFHREVRGAVILDSAATAGGPPLAYDRRGNEIRSGISAAAALRIGSFLAEFTGDYLAYGEGTRRRYAPGWNLGGGIYIRDRLVGGHLDLKMGFRGRYFSAYDGEGYSQRYELFVPTGFDIPPAETVDFVLFAGIGDAVIHFIWENLLDRHYTMLVLYPMDDRAVRFGLTWNFLD